MDLLTTNNPGACLPPASTFYTPKVIESVRNPKFANVFETRMHGAILDLLGSSLPDQCGWTLHVLRLGFNRQGSITVHLAVTQDSLSENEACELAEKMNAIISAQWQGEE